MRVLMLTDLHIRSGSEPASIHWVGEFCKFLRCNCSETAYIFILGDIIDKGDPGAFAAADLIFSCIEQELKGFDYHFFFLPGNHDYCNGGLEEFDRFVQSHQSDIANAASFRRAKAHCVKIGQINFIMTDSINAGNYKLPGVLDLEAISKCVRAEAKNVLLLHHSLIFEDSATHTGIVELPKVLEFLKVNKIEYVFHGHSHATRNLSPDSKVFHYGVGSIGVNADELSGLINEQEQFLEVQINETYIERVTNWLYRGGEQGYKDTIIYPQLNRSYNDRAVVEQIKYPCPENYIQRYVKEREQTEDDEFNLFFEGKKKTSLANVLQKNQYVVLLADAGLGKSVELQYTAYRVSETNPYFLPIIMPLNVYNGESILDYIKRYAPVYQSLNPAQFLLIFDGYDEIERPNAFKRELKKFITENKGTKICISMRSNFLPETSDAFDKFSIFNLLDLTYEDVKAYLTTREIDDKEMVSQCKQKGLSHLLYNPFYLQEIADLFISHREIPKPHELMQKIISLRISKDSAKFEYARAELLEEQRYELLMAQTKLAYGMQLLAITYCSQDTYSMLLSSKDREFVKYSSIIVKKPHGYEFSHNIFREYLAACYLNQLSLSEIINIVSVDDGKLLNHNWFNVLGFILQMRNNTDLIDWIYGVEPLMLTRLESDRVGDVIRFNVLQKTVEEIENKNIWFNSGVCTEDQLAVFSQSARAVDMLLEHITDPKHFRVQYFCLRVLSCFPSLHGKETQVFTALMECVKDPLVRPHEKRIAISAIAELGLSTDAVISDLTTTYALSESSYIRLGIYEHLLEMNKVNEYVDFVLDGIRLITYHYKRNEISNGSEDIRLRECLRAISSPAAVIKTIKWFAKKKNLSQSYYSKKDFLKSIIQRAGEHYLAGQMEQFDAVFELLLAAQEQFSRKEIATILGFFVQTMTTEQAFGRLLSVDEGARLFTIDDFVEVHPPIVEFFCKLYLENKLEDPQIFIRFTNRWTQVPSVFLSCAEAIKTKTGRTPTVDTPKYSYSELSQRDNQAFFDALFDKKQMERLHEQLIETCGDEDITVGELKNRYISIEDMPPGTHKLKFAIVQGFEASDYVKDFFLLVNWDAFVRSRLCQKFRQDGEFAELAISQNQRDALQGQFDVIGKDIDFHSAFTQHEDGSGGISWDMYYYLLMKRRFDFTTDKPFYYGLLEIPHFYLEGETLEAKYQYIEQYLSVKEITVRIIALLPNESRSDIMQDLVYACARYHILEAIEYVIKYCCNSKIPAYQRKIGLDYLAENLGLDTVVEKIVPTSDDELFGLIIDMLKSTEGHLIRDELLHRYSMCQSPKLLGAMIYFNLPEGLTEYIDKSRKINQPLETDNSVRGLTESISAVNNPTLLNLLCDAVTLRFSEGFVDASFHTLYSALFTAFTNCAKNDYVKTVKAIEELRTRHESNLECISFCNSVIDRIVEDNRAQLTKVWTISEVRPLLDGISRIPISFS